jgi:hypothetical protein
MATNDKMRGQDTAERCECGRGQVAYLLRICTVCLRERAAAFWATMR